LLLTPQHLQHLDRYHEEADAELFGASLPFSYGLSGLGLDEDAIQNGQVIIPEAKGITPGGAAFSFPDRDDVPPGRSLEQSFPVGTNNLPVYLGIRAHRSGEREISDGDNGEVRYRSGPIKAYDQTTGENEREIRICHQNLRILFPEENLGDYDYLQVAEIARKPEGGYEFREDFVPPCISIAASGYILKILARIQENLVARSKSLSDRRQHRGQGVAEFGREDVAGFWLLGTVNGYIPLLSHFLKEKNSHPETVYLTLAAMAGELTTMSDLDVRETPSYQHDHLGETFSGLAQRLPQMLKEVLPQAYERIPLTVKDESILQGRENG
jgi:type VI secretion system protein ImpJ